MKRLAVIVAIFLAACGGGEIEVDVREPTATEEDVLKCGVGAYFVPPPQGSEGRGHCVAYPQLPASAPQ